MIVLINRFVINNYHTIPDQYKKPEYFTHKNIAGWTASNNSNNLFFDRTGVLPSPFNTSYPHPLPLTDDYIDTRFDVIVANRMRQLLATGKLIHLYWSGGIDSTCILASLFQHADDRSQFVVHFTDTSIIESGTLFERYIRHNCNWVHENVATNRYTGSDDIYLSGLLGNHIMGQGSTNHNFPISSWERPYQDYIDKHPRMSNQFVEWIEPVLDYYPRKTITFFDYQRLYHMCFRWHHEHYLPAIKQFKTTIFYDTTEFQQWAMYSNQLPYGTHLMKTPMKEIIKSVFNDQYYHERKKTSPSQHIVGYPDWKFVLSNGELIL